MRMYYMRNGTFFANNFIFLTRICLKLDILFLASI